MLDALEKIVSMIGVIVGIIVAISQPSERLSEQVRKARAALGVMLVIICAILFYIFVTPADSHDAIRRGLGGKSPHFVRHGPTGVKKADETTLSWDRVEDALWIAVTIQTKTGEKEGTHVIDGSSSSLSSESLKGAKGVSVWYGTVHGPSATTEVSLLPRTE